MMPPVQTETSTFIHHAPQPTNRGQIQNQKATKTDAAMSKREKDQRSQRSPFSTQQEKAGRLAASQQFFLLIIE